MNNSTSKEKTVYIVHAVDVEGPMTEPIQATFERMRAYGLPSDISANQANLVLIQDGKLKGVSEPLMSNLQKVFNRRSLSYLTNWNQIDSMITDITSEKYRSMYCGKRGEPYVFSWFIYDHHEGFNNNPRFHDIGTHKIFDHYKDELLRKSPYKDGIYWHYHHPAISGDALESNTCWSNRTNHEEIIARRIIDRKWYFSCFRAGLHIERNDNSHWLEMFFPFDFSARYSQNPNAYNPGSDFDWRGCPSKWGAWHPDWYDYRKEGSMKRYVFRCTDLWTYLSKLHEDEVLETFEQADKFGNSVLTYYNHDYRDMRLEIAEGYDVIVSVAKRYPHINWKFVNALESAQKHLGLTLRQPKLSYELNDNLLEVRCDGELFGPQPFLAIQEGEQYFRDNFNSEGENRWFYKFRNLDKVRSFGVAANSPSGLYDCIVITF